jgi:hypothetical protein
MTARNPNGGWILLETIVALAVLSIGVVAVNRALGQALETRAQARDYTQARFLLEQLVGELELQPALKPDTTESGRYEGELSRFSWNWSVSSVEVAAPEVRGNLPLIVQERLRMPPLVLGKLAVTVRWTRAGREFAEKVETLVAPERLQAKEEEIEVGEP